MVKAVVGANWGDEGKGKITDTLADKADVVIRFQGGANAGHTIVNDYGKTHNIKKWIYIITMYNSIHLKKQDLQESHLVRQSQESRLFIQINIPRLAGRSMNSSRMMKLSRKRLTESPR